MKKLNQKGFSLLEITLAGALLAGLGVVMMKQNQDAQKAQQTISQGAEKIQLQARVRRLLMNGDICQNSLGGMNPNSNLDLSTTDFSAGDCNSAFADACVRQLIPAAGADPVMSLGDKAGQGLSAVEVTHMLVHNHNAATNEALFTMVLRKSEASRGGKTYGQEYSRYSFPVVIEPAADGTIQDCRTPAEDYGEAMCGALGGIYDRDLQQCRSIHVRSNGASPAIIAENDLDVLGDINSDQIIARGDIATTGGVIDVKNEAGSLTQSVSAENGNARIEASGDLVVHARTVETQVDTLLVSGNLLVQSPERATLEATEINLAGPVNAGPVNVGGALVASQVIRGQSGLEVRGETLLEGATTIQGETRIEGTIQADDLRIDKYCASGTTKVLVNGAMECIDNSTMICANQGGRVRALKYNANGRPVCQTIIDTGASCPAGQVVQGLEYDTHQERMVPKCCSPQCPESSSYCSNEEVASLNACPGACNAGSKPASPNFWTKNSVSHLARGNTCSGTCMSAGLNEGTKNTLRSCKVGDCGGVGGFDQCRPGEVGTVEEKCTFQCEETRVLLYTHAMGSYFTNERMDFTSLAPRGSVVKQIHVRLMGTGGAGSEHQTSGNEGGGAGEVLREDNIDATNIEYCVGSIGIPQKTGWVAATTLNCYDSAGAVVYSGTANGGHLGRTGGGTGESVQFYDEFDNLVTYDGGQDRTVTRDCHRGQPGAGGGAGTWTGYGCLGGPGRIHIWATILSKQ